MHDNLYKRLHAMSKFLTEEGVPLESITIQVTKGVKECVDEFFNHYERMTHEHKKYVSHKKLDYFKMKRFLFTAYNNLLDIDHSFFDDSLAELKNSMLTFDEMYKDFKTKTKFPHLSFEYVFLDQQEHFEELNKRFKHNHSQIGILKSSCATYDAEVKKLEAYIKKIDKKDAKHAAAQEKLKKYKGGYVDSVHRLRNLRDENAILYDKLDAFKKQYEEEFKEEFAKVVGLAEKDLVEILDSYAHKFDKMMWQEAAESKAIYEYFENVGIIDDFSSKTFLKYYLNTLDNEKLNKANQELKELLIFMESQIDLSIVLYEEDQEMMQRMYQIVSNINDNYYVYKINEQKTLVNTLISKDVDILFLGRGKDFNSLLRLFQRMESGFKHEIENISYCLLDESFSSAEIMEARKHNITTFIKTSAPDGVVQDKITQFCKKIENRV
jgi:hypothetical protein